MPTPPRKNPQSLRKHNDPPPHRDNQDVPRPTTDLQRNKPRKVKKKVKPRF